MVSTPPPSIALPEAPPRYSDAVSSNAADANLQIIAFEQEQDDIPDFDPPPFTYPPQTLNILPKSRLITPLPTHLIPSPRALYELTQPVDIYSSANGVYSILPLARLRADGRCVSLSQKNYLYQIYETLQFPRNDKYTSIGAQHRALVQGTILIKESGIKGSKWEARAHGPDWRSTDVLIFEGRERRWTGKGKRRMGLEWKDGKGSIVAVEGREETGGEREERLEVLEEMEKRDLDILVAVWVARIWQDARREAKREDKQDEKRRREEQKIRDREAGKPHGRLYDVKEVLGIGHGLKAGPVSGGWPTLGGNERIKWR